MLPTTGHKQPAKTSQLSDRKQRIYDFLFNTSIGVLSSTDPNGDPHGAVIYYTIDDGFEISFLTKSETKKYDNLIHNNHVMLTVFEPLTQTTVQVTGVAREMKDDLVVKVLASKMLGTSLRTSDAGMPPLSKLEAGAYVVFRIEPVQVRMVVYARPESGDYSELFETVESFGHNDDD
jgi:uncharacterized pyridoxamine 5'-phosphate oxidase family protein